MPLSGNFAGLRRLRNSLDGLARRDGAGNTLLLSGVQREVKGLLKDEFLTGTDPNGSPWQKTVRGKAALVSSKLAHVFVSRIDHGAVQFIGKVARNWLEAHQTGYTFRARSVGPLSQYLTFNQKGRLIKSGKILNKKGEVRRGAFQTFAKAHTVGQRILPERPIIPVGALPPKWESAIGLGITRGMNTWYERATR